MCKYCYIVMTATPQHPYGIMEDKNCHKIYLEAISKPQKPTVDIKQNLLF